jgi:diguanylate cyclase (GGDEF)-like protein
MAVNELEKVVGGIGSSATQHYARLKKFQKRVAKLGTQPGDVVWDDLCRQVEGILDPTLQLVSEIANAQERIRYQSNYLMTFSDVRTDPLTGLGNRRALDHVLGMQFSLLKRYGKPFSLAIIDIDHFKDLNDAQGHQYGDQILQDLTGLLTDTVRTVDVLARFGGDEFVIVMPQTDIPGAEILGQRLRGEVERRMPFTVSVGLASSDRTDTPESLFKRADIALYHAKSNGRNCVFCEHGETGDTVLQKVVTGAD